MGDNDALDWLKRRAEKKQSPSFGFNSSAQTSTSSGGKSVSDLDSSFVSKFGFKPSSQQPPSYAGSGPPKFGFLPTAPSQDNKPSQSSPTDDNGSRPKFGVRPTSSNAFSQSYYEKTPVEETHDKNGFPKRPLAPIFTHNNSDKKPTGQTSSHFSDSFGGSSSNRPKFGLPGMTGQPPQPPRQAPPPPHYSENYREKRTLQKPYHPQGHDEPTVPKRPRNHQRQYSPPPPAARRQNREPYYPQSNRNNRQGGQRGSAVPPSEEAVPFRTAHEQLLIDDKAKGVTRQGSGGYGQSKRTLGVSRQGSVSSGFKPPIPNQNDGDQQQLPPDESQPSEPKDERYKNIDDKMIELITNEIMDQGAPIDWSDIAGLDYVKTTVKEVVVFPLLRPDIFCGLRSPPKGILLFGPPGTGKTLIGKCIASQSKSTFFSISASSLTSKWVGEGEKMVRALFAVARVHQPSVVFIDEIDSLLSARSDSEHESSRRIKTEFLVQLDGCSTVGEERILIVGATNRPQDLDEAARRRLVKRLYVPLPDSEARKQIVVRLLSDQTSHTIQESDLSRISDLTEGYSGADMANLAKEAAMGPIRSLDYSKIDKIEATDVRPIGGRDLL